MIEYYRNELFIPINHHLKPLSAYTMDGTQPAVHSIPVGLYQHLRYGLFGLLEVIASSDPVDPILTMAREHLDQSYGHISLDPDATMEFYFDPGKGVATNFLLNSLMALHEKIKGHNQSVRFSQRFALQCAFLLEHQGVMTLVTLGQIQAYEVSARGVRPMNIPEDARFLVSDLDTQDLIWPTAALGLADQIQLQARDLKKSSDVAYLLLSGGLAQKVDLERVQRYFQWRGHQSFAQQWSNFLTEIEELGSLGAQSLLYLKP
jgi:PPM family protein phosphatase